MKRDRLSKGVLTTMTAAFSSATMETKRQEGNIFKVWKENKSQHRILYAVKFISESQILGHFQASKANELTSHKRAGRHTSGYTSLRKFSPERSYKECDTSEIGATASSHQPREPAANMSAILRTGC